MYEKKNQLCSRMLSSNSQSVTDKLQHFIGTLCTTMYNNCCSHKRTNKTLTLLYCFRKNSHAIIVATRAPTMMLTAADTPSATALTCWTLLITGTWTFRHVNETADVVVASHVDVDMVLNTNINHRKSSSRTCKLIYYQQYETFSDSEVNKQLKHSATSEITHYQFHVNNYRNEYFATLHIHHANHLCTLHTNIIQRQ